MATDILDDEDEKLTEDSPRNRRLARLAGQPEAGTDIDALQRARGDKGSPQAMSSGIVAPPQPGVPIGLPAVGSSAPDETHSGLEEDKPSLVAAPGMTASSVAPPNITMAPAYPEGSSPSTATGQMIPPVSAPQQKLQDLQAGQSGVSKMHGLGGGIVKGLDVAGSILAPRAMQYIPGSTLNYQHQLDVAHQNVTADNAQRQQEQQIADTQAQEEQRQAQAEKAQAQTEAIQNPVAKPINPPNPAAIAAAAKLGYKFGDDGLLLPMEDSELSPEIKNQRALSQATKDLRKAQTDLANSKNDPNSAAYKLEQARVDEARERTHQAMTGLGLRQEEFQNKKDEQGIVKPSGQAQSRASAAEAALNVMPHLSELVRKNGASMGPLMGRISRGEVAIGNVPPDVAELYGAMKSFYALQPAVHGFRNAEFVKDFETALGTLERDPEAFIAGMKGLEPTMKAVADEGKTFHKRIVEGGTNQSPSSGGTVIKYDKDGNRIK